jgi:hypothetical protein
VWVCIILRGTFREQFESAEEKRSFSYLTIVKIAAMHQLDSSDFNELLGN